MKIIKVIACLSVLVLLSGCTGILWSSNKVATPRLERKVQIQDKVTAIFLYRNLAASVIQGEKKISLDIPSEGTAFVGEKNVYILTSGAAELLSLNRLTTRIPLISGHEENTLKFRLMDPSKNTVDIHFRENVPIEVNQSARQLSDEERDIIRRAGFVDNGERYVKNVGVGGVIIPKGNLNYIPDKSESLGRKYNIEFYSLNDTTDFHPVNLATNVIFTPLALAADIVFFPISISVLQLVNGS